MNLKYKQELVKVLLSVKDKKLMDEFLQDILTPAEYADIVKRWQIVKNLRKGRPQREIARELGVSISKVTRGSRVLLDGKGGFKRILDR